jgi:hypothetical protein
LECAFDGRAEGATGTNPQASFIFAQDAVVIGSSYLLSAKSNATSPQIIVPASMLGLVQNSTLGRTYVFYLHALVTPAGASAGAFNITVKVTEVQI